MHRDPSDQLPSMLLMLGLGLPLLLLLLLLRLLLLRLRLLLLRNALQLPACGPVRPPVGLLAARPAVAHQAAAAAEPAPRQGRLAGACRCDALQVGALPGGQRLRRRHRPLQLLRLTALDALCPCGEELCQGLGHLCLQAPPVLWLHGCHAVCCVEQVQGRDQARVPAGCAGLLDQSINRCVRCFILESSQKRKIQETAFLV